MADDLQQGPRDEDEALATATGDARLRLYRCIRRTFGTEDGQITFAWLKRQFHYGRTPYVAHDREDTAFHCGQQDVVNHLVEIVATPFEQLAEQARAEAQEQAASQSIRNPLFGLARPGNPLF